MLHVNYIQHKKSCVLCLNTCVLLLINHFSSDPYIVPVYLQAVAQRNAEGKDRIVVAAGGFHLALVGICVAGADRDPFIQRHLQGYECVPAQVGDIRQGRLHEGDMV